MFTIKEIDAIRFYQGDIRKRDEHGQITEHERNEGFRGIPSAYRTMNCLMFEGISNEEERIKEQNGSLVPRIYEEAEKVIEVYCDIYRAMCKSAAVSDTSGKKLVYHTERGVSIESLKKGNTVSFTSTSKENKPEEFLRQKEDLTLLTLIFSPEIPHLDFQEVLGEDYYFAHQKEILLPPFLEIELEELELTEEEQQYRDVNNQPPRGKYLVLVKGMQSRKADPENENWKPLTAERNQRSAEMLQKLIDRKTLTQIEMDEYCQWKRDVRTMIWREFQKIEQQYLKRKEADRKDQLMMDVKNMRQEFNEKRKGYKRKIKLYNFGLILTNTVPLACMALSFLEAFQVEMKIAAVITSMISIFLSQMLRVEVYDTKIMQRSKTYLYLCDLSREMKYEREWDKQKEDMYIRKFREIMREDTIMSLHNLEMQVKNTEKLYSGEIKEN